MNKEQLRIGNTILAWTISDQWKEKQIPSGAELDFILDHAEDDIYRPVPLTHEYIECCDFSFVANGQPDMAVSTSWKIDDEKPIEVHFVTGNFHKKIEYVHELENLYADFIGKPLKKKEKCLEH